MDDKTWLELTSYAWVVFWSSWGGVASYISKIKKGRCRFSIAELIGELCISGFVGVLTFMLCRSADLSEMLTAAMIGIASHMGSRAIFFIEEAAKTKLTNWLGLNDKSV